MTLSGLTSRAADALWNRDMGAATRGVRWGTSLLRLTVAVLRDMREGHLSLRASALSYITLLSFAPLLALSFSVLKGFGAGGELEPFLLNLLKPLGDQRTEVTARIVEFVSNVQTGVLGALGLALLIYSVLALMHEIELAFNDIWRVQARRPFAIRVRDYLSVLLIGPVLMFISVAITATLRHADIGAALPLKLAGDAVAWLLFALAFAALYMFMPYTRVRALPAFVAGFITGALWKILGWLFGVFVAGSASYAAVYSAFAALALFMIWVNVGWQMVLVGASICYYLQNPSSQRLGRRNKPLSPRVREKLALGICAAVGDAFYKHAPAPDVSGLSAILSLPMTAVAEVAEILSDTGFIAGTGPGARAFIPARPFDTTPCGDMLEALRAAGEDTGVAWADLKTPAVTAGMTLKQLSQGSKTA